MKAEEIESEDETSAVLKKLVETIVTTLVDKPDQVKISVLQSARLHVIEVEVADNDIGMVIGSHGATAHAIRRLLYNAAAKHKTNAHLEILEPRDRQKA